MSVKFFKFLQDHNIVIYCLMFAHYTFIGITSSLTGITDTVYHWFYPRGLIGAGPNGNVTLPGGSGWISLGTCASETFADCNHDFYGENAIFKIVPNGLKENRMRNSEITLGDEIKLLRNTPVYIVNFLNSGISKISFVPTSRLVSSDLTNVILNNGCSIRILDLRWVKNTFSNNKYYRVWAHVELVAN